MEKLIDLHTHSTMSDGSMTPTEVVRHAKEAGLAAMALTDHDTVAGVRQAMDEGRRLGIEVVPGIELSAKSATETHVLGYYIDINNADLSAALKDILIERENRTVRTCQKLNDLGFDVSVEEAKALAPAGVVGRAHFAKLMVNKGYTSSVKEGFELYFDNGRPAYSGRQNIDRFQAVDLIKNAGGLAFIAHLHLTRMEDDELEAFLTELRDYGLDGIEGYYTDYTPPMQAKYMALANKLGLMICGGTDFHAQMKPHIGIGKGLGDLKIPYSVLAAMKERLGIN
ncbi:MAG: PHP domain-containing protein [Clostridiales bacterium]|nr:PHP domain-containing protein [Clostridiales bacterium]